MKYVYILQSIKNPDRFYTGATYNLKRRFKEHNDGKSLHTKKFKPWIIKTYIAFNDPMKADCFESFLKSGNGRLFMKKHF